MPLRGKSNYCMKCLISENIHELCFAPLHLQWRRSVSGPRGCRLLYILPFTLSHSPLKESTDKLQQRRPPSFLHGIPVSLFGAVTPDYFQWIFFSFCLFFWEKWLKVCSWKNLQLCTNRTHNGEWEHKIFFFTNATCHFTIHQLSAVFQRTLWQLEKAAPHHGQGENRICW